MWIRSAIPPMLSLSFTLLAGSTGYLRYCPVSSVRGILLPILMGGLFSYVTSISKLSNIKWLDEFPPPLSTPLFFLLFHFLLLLFYPLCRYAPRLPWSFSLSLRNAVFQLTSMLIFCLLSPTKRKGARERAVHRYLQWLKTKNGKISKKTLEKDRIQRCRKQVALREEDLDRSITQLQRERFSLSHSWTQLHSARKKWAQLLASIQRDVCCSIGTILQVTKIVKSDMIRGLLFRRNAG